MRPSRIVIPAVAACCIAAHPLLADENPEPLPFGDPANRIKAGDADTVFIELDNESYSGVKDRFQMFMVVLSTRSFDEEFIKEECPGFVEAFVLRRRGEWPFLVVKKFDKAALTSNVIRVSNARGATHAFVLGFGGRDYENILFTRVGAKTTRKSKPVMIAMDAPPTNDFRALPRSSDAWESACSLPPPGSDVPRKKPGTTAGDPNTDIEAKNRAIEAKNREIEEYNRRVEAENQRIRARNR